MTRKLCSTERNAKGSDVTAVSLTVLFIGARLKMPKSSAPNCSCSVANSPSPSCAE